MRELYAKSKEKCEEISEDTSEDILLKMKVKISRMALLLESQCSEFA